MPEHCGPRSPLPPEKQNRSIPICAYVFRFSIGGIPAASSSSSGTPAFFVTARAAFSRSPSQVVYTIAVRSVRAPARSSTLPTTTSFAPANRMALSNALRPPSMTTSFFMPVVSGSCHTLFGSVPAMQPAVAAAIAPAAPEVTMPDSAPDSCASFRPAAFCSSKMSTKCWAASAIARLTSGSSSEPLKYVHVPRALMKGRTPSRR